MKLSCQRRQVETARAGGKRSSSYFEFEEPVRSLCGWKYPGIAPLEPFWRQMGKQDELRGDSGAGDRLRSSGINRGDWGDKNGRWAAGQLSGDHHSALLIHISFRNVFCQGMFCAGRMMKGSFASEQGLNCLSLNQQLLSHDSWNNHYQFTYPRASHGILRFFQQLVENTFLTESVVVQNTSSH